MSGRYYLNSPLAVGRVILQGPEAHHLAAVCRVRPGDAVRLFNGDGAEYPAQVLEITKKQVGLEIVGRETPVRELDFRLEVAAPLPKGDRGDYLIEKLTEVGVSHFVPLETRRSVVHPNVDRLRRAVIEASKQCGRNVLMEIAPVEVWDSYCRRGDLPARRLLAHPGGGALQSTKTGDVAVAVGPEGGPTDDELKIAADAGWNLVGLGPRTLRVRNRGCRVGVDDIHEMTGPV